MYILNLYTSNIPKKNTIKSILLNLCIYMYVGRYFVKKFSTKYVYIIRFFLLKECDSMSQLYYIFFPIMRLLFRNIIIRICCNKLK